MATIAAWTGTGLDLRAYWSMVQTFTTPASDYSVTSVRIRIANGAPQPYTVTTVELYAVDAEHKPTGAAIGNFGSLTSGSLTTTFTLKTFNVVGTCNVSASTEYAIVITTVGDVGHFVSWDGKYGYASGVSWTQLTEGGSWDGQEDRYFIVIGNIVPSGPFKPTNPDPIDETILDGCYDRIFGWSIDVEVDTYAFYIGSSPGSLILLDDTITESTYTVSEVSFPTGGTVYWRVDATNEGGTTTGDVWSFDPMPGKPDNPTPADTVGNVSTTQSRIYWDAGKLSQSWNVYFGPVGSMVLVESNVTTEYWDTDTELPLDASTQYSWRIDAVNVNGTVTGDVWTFTTGLASGFSPPGSTTDTWTDGGGSWTYYTGENFLCITNRLVALGNNMLYYESLGS